MQFDETLDDRQAEAGAATTAAIGSRLEAAEHRIEYVRRHAGAIVVNREFNASGKLAARERDGARLRRVVHGVAQEIVEDLADAGLVAMERLRRGGGIDLELDRVLLQPVGDQVGGGTDGPVDMHFGNVEFHDAGIHRGQVEYVVDDGQQDRRRRAHMSDIFALLRVQRPGRRQRQKLGEADDVGQRRAQFVGDVLDELVLELVGLFQRLVPVLQRPLDMDAVGDIDEGHHHLPIGQRDHGVAQHIAVVEFCLAVAIAALIVEAGDRGNEPSPGVVGGALVAEIADGRDMDIRLGDVVAQSPECGESRVRQPEPSVRTEDGHALGEVVERFALDAYRGLVTAFEVHLLGQVLEHPGHAALGLRIGDHADGFSVGQMPPMFLRFDGAIGAEQAFLPPTPFGLLGDLALAAQPV